jgi:hypothetical protein
MNETSRRASTRREMQKQFWAAAALTSAGLLAAAMAQTALPRAEPNTTWVAGSREPIPLPYPRTGKLPRRLSIDAFTEAEIRQIKADIYAELKDVPPRRVEGVDGCMAWLYKRHAPTQAWQAFGFAVDGNRGFKAAKINGALRRVSLHYTITPDTYMTLFLYGSHRPSKRPGRGYSTTALQEAGSGYRELKRLEAAQGELEFEMFSKKEDPAARMLHFGQSDAVRISDKKMRCTHLNALCRRYIVPVSKPAYWAPYSSDLAPNENIATEPRLQTELAIEDMCPFGRQGLVEGDINTRSGGAEPGMRKYGIKNNSSLRDAVKL